MDALRLINYKCFKDTGLIDLKPINFLVGSNSSGKSSFIKMFPLLKQSSGIRRNGVFLWNGPAVDLKDFDNVVKDGENSIEVEFLIKDFSVPRKPMSRSKNKTDLKVRFRILRKERNFDFLEKLTISFADQKIEIRFNPRTISGEILINGNSTKENFDNCLYIESNGLLPRLIFFDPKTKYRSYDDTPIWCRNQLKLLQNGEYPILGSLFRNIFLVNKEKTVNHVKNTISLDSNAISVTDDELNEIYLLCHVNNIIEGINNNLLHIAKNISYVGPLRATTQRFYRFQNYTVEEIDSDGTNLAMYLYNLDPLSFGHFQNWTERLFNFTVELSSNNGNIEILINEQDKRKHNMVDIGFGYTQILPILAIVWKKLYQDINEPIYSVTTKRNQHIVAIEQPELHLHPRLQGLFAEMIVKVINEAKNQKRDLRFIIETHSEIIINRIGYLIASQDCDNEDVNVYLFNAQHEGFSSYIEKSSYSKNGQLLNWPYGFFSDYVF